MELEDEQAWVTEELLFCDVMARFFATGDTGRQVSSQAAWDIYTIDLRDYITGDTINGSRPTTKPS